MSYLISTHSLQSTTAVYLDTTGANLVFKAGSTYSGGNDTNSTADIAGYVPYSAFLDALFSAAFLPPAPATTESNVLYDGWGNTRIPLIDQLDSPVSSDWITITEPPIDIEAYSSLYGIPVVQTQPSAGDNSSIEYELAQWNFTMSSAYWTFTCSDLIETSLENITFSNRSLTQSAGGTLNMGMDFTSDSEGSFLGQLYFGSAIIAPGGTFDASLGDIAYSECNFTQKFVQTNVTCGTDMASCQPTGMRLTPPASRPSTLIPTTFTDWLTYTSADVPSLTERYIYDPSPADEDELNPEKGFSLLDPKITQEVFTRRLALLVNSFWTIGFAPMYITGNLTQFNPLQVATLHEPATGSIFYDASNVYAYSPPWTGVLFVCSIILVLFGITNVIWESRTIGPNVLGFASSIVRNSRYIDAPKISSAMSGPEKARMLGNLKVMMQDVRAGDDVGKIALGTVNEGAQRLKAGRLYK
jgi:hypothetical protein